MRGMSSRDRATPPLSVLAGLSLAALIVAACGEAAPTGPSWVDRTHASAAPSPSGDDDLGLQPIDDGGDGGACAIPADEGSVEPGDDAGGGQPAASFNTGVGNDPYTATGARQVPGPNMHLQTPPAQPVSLLVAAPVDPDEHVAARDPDGKVTGPVPSPRSIGGAPAPAGNPVPGVTPTPGGGGSSAGDCAGGGL